MADERHKNLSQKAEGWIEAIRLFASFSVSCARVGATARARTATPPPSLKV